MDIKRRNIPVDLTKCKYLGKGHSGEVYLMPDKKRIVKIFKSANSCKAEFDILKSVEKSLHFPKAYELGEYYMIREYVGGTNVYDYIKAHGIEKSFVLNITSLIDELKSYGFTKLELRFPHLFVQEDGTLMLIDPRKSYQEDIPYPKSFLRKLNKMGLLDEFFKILQKERPDIDWQKYYTVK